ncbi:Uncharacterised protein [Chlamydia trachomatis]|nr:Uncharacterised protein [Chlamydia trachomatis]
MPPFPEFSRYSDVDEDMIDKDFNLFDSQRSDTNNDGIFLEESFDE